MFVTPRSIDQLPLAHRHKAWLDWFEELSLSASVDDQPIPRGTMRLRAASATTRLADISGTPQRIVPMRQSHGVLFALIVAGRGRLVAPQQAVDLADGDMMVLGTADDWSLTFRSDFRAFLLQAAVGPLEARLGRNGIRLPKVLGSTVVAAVAKSGLRTLGSSLETSGAADLTAAGVALTELVASALLGEIREPAGSLTGVQAAHFRRVAAAIDARLSDADLALAVIARLEGLSVRYAQKLFEARGESFSDYVRQQRLEHCRIDLADPNHAHESVASIGQRWGFRDQSHFSRAFGATFGMSPKQVRHARAQTEETYPLRGKPGGRKVAPARSAQMLLAPMDRPPTAIARERFDHWHLPATAETVHWGFFSRSLPPVLRVDPGDTVTVETLTQHAGDDWQRMVAGDSGAESVFEWSPERKLVDRRGAGPANASIFGRGAGEGFGVHIMTGPIYVRGAEPGDVLEIEFVDIRPRPSATFPGKTFASNVSAWWGFQYHDLLNPDAKRETVTIFEIDTQCPTAARPLYSYEWQPQTDPFGVVHPTIDYPGVPVDHSKVSHRDLSESTVRIPARMHFGCVAVAPREADLVDSIPPGYFGGNVDNWRIGAGAKLYLPVAVHGALLSLGDGHFAQADGEINGTGLECSLTGDILIKLHKTGDACPAFLRGLNSPLIETERSWVIQSFSHPNYLKDLGSNAQSDVYKKSTIDLALRNAFRQTRRFIMQTYDLTEDEVLSIMSLAADFGITQVADGNFGVHATIDKAVFGQRHHSRRTARG
ncbi:AraC family transcriptional regulator protein (plasmid) [Rhizobium etli 8C-3]|uniref:AraC family transcriptional regulator protein n=1 Tax=Rhizobium etli 8C-3 TaxID=538025 RepID=A0A1L5PCR6_RHIET|nr:acetamidase/formamidase family protein [Rhizobium etli]APO77903.1 AraC family transcriptional regulator protein [Rhizobium etli 8C-3]